MNFINEQTTNQQCSNAPHIYINLVHEHVAHIPDLEHCHFDITATPQA